MTVVVEKSKPSITFDDLNIGDMFTWYGTDFENLKDCLYLKVTDISAFDLTRNTIGIEGTNFKCYSNVKRVKGHLVVEEVEE